MIILWIRGHISNIHNCKSKTKLFVISQWHKDEQLFLNWWLPMLYLIPRHQSACWGLYVGRELSLYLIQSASDVSVGSGSPPVFENVDVTFTIGLVIMKILYHYKPFYMTHTLSYIQSWVLHAELCLNISVTDEVQTKFKY